MTENDRTPWCGRCVLLSALRAVGQGKHCRIRDLAQTLQRQGVQAIAALERDDRPTIRERAPRRLPWGTGNRTAAAKQSGAGALHTSRTALARVPPTVMRRRADGARRGRVVCTCSRSASGVMTEAADSKTVGAVSPPMQGPMHGAFTLCAPARSPGTVGRWTLRRHIRDDRPQAGTVLVTRARRLHVDSNGTETGSIAR